MRKQPGEEAVRSETWPDGTDVVQVRIARPTDKLEEVVAFYRDGLGLPMIGSFEGHAGYDGVMIGLPGRGYHLEFTRQEAGSPGTAPSRDNLLVLYIPDAEQVERLRARLERLGYPPVGPENPYWLDKSVTFEDPDGWRLVLSRTGGI
jgi:catechol 2,3-dioxygenase-like lactoylglutathione lyase family enzyme